jgi:hypothetical protein
MKFLIIMCIVSFSATTGAVITSREQEQKAQAKLLMDGVYESFLNVIPYIYSDEDSLLRLKSNKKEKDELVKNLSTLSVFFKSATHVEYFDRPGFRPNLETMNSHLSDTISSIQSNNLLFAQKRLGVLTSLCINCHSQLSSKGTQNAFSTALEKSKREQFESDFAYGNYLYLIRQFPEAEKYLLLALERALLESRSHQLYTSLRRIISIHTKITFNYEKARDFVSKYSKDLKVPKMARDNLLEWSNALEKWKKFRPEEVSDIDEFIKKYLSPLEEIKEQIGMGDNDVSLLIASGVLSKYLVDHPTTSSAPQILYWLSVAERRLSNTYFFTISDLYLKDCIKLYPQSPYARKCYNLYEENVQFGYTGSRGIDVPPGEKMELTRLRNLLK